MARGVLSLCVLLYTIHLALSQDCSTEAGQLEYLTDNLDSNRACYSSLISSMSSDEDIPVEDVEAICQEDCVGEVVKFLTSTEKCRNDANVKETVSFLKDVLCSFEDVEKPATSCIYYDIDSDSRFISPTLISCAGWWLEGASDTCPDLLEGISGVDSCEEVLEETYSEVGCCYLNYLRMDGGNQNFTQAFIAGLRAGGYTGNIPDDINLDLTDEDLLNACGITGRKPCTSTVEDDEDAAVIPVVTPLIVLLFALLSGLVA